MISRKGLFFCFQLFFTYGRLGLFKLITDYTYLLLVYLAFIGGLEEARCHVFSKDDFYLGSLMKVTNHSVRHGPSYGELVMVIFPPLDSI